VRRAARRWSTRWFSPFSYRRTLLEACEERGIALEGYSPLTHGRDIDHPEIAEIAERLGRTRPGAPLLTEGDLVLATEVEGSEQPSAVLHAIAGGKTRHNEIKDGIRAEPARTLDRLIDLHLVERLVPVTDDAQRTRRRLYRITDNFLAFHLGMVTQYRAEIDRGLGASILPIGRDRRAGARR